MIENDIIDRIDALVDEQLANYPNRSGYDHNINQARCRCGRDWHGLPITKRIDGMRSYGEFDPGYTFAEDDSPVMCVGSNTPGPWRQVGLWQLPDDSLMRSLNFVPGSVVSISNGNGWTRIGTIDRIESSPLIGDAVVSIRAHMTAFSEAVTTAMESASATFSGIASQPSVEPDTRTPRQRALPRPSTTAPMWAHDVNRSRRPKRRRGQPNRQGIA